MAANDWLELSELAIIQRLNPLDDISGYYAQSKLMTIAITEGRCKGGQAYSYTLGRGVPDSALGRGVPPGFGIDGVIFAFGGVAADATSRSRDSCELNTSVRSVSSSIPTPPTTLRRRGPTGALVVLSSSSAVSSKNPPAVI